MRLDSEAGDDRLYCFLPMGRDARSPFQGHLNAPFSVAIARKALVEDTPLNELLLDVGAELCCSAVTPLASDPWARMAIADLVAWKPAEVDRLISGWRGRARSPG